MLIFPLPLLVMLELVTPLMLPLLPPGEGEGEGERLRNLRENLPMDHDDDDDDDVEDDSPPLLPHTPSAPASDEPPQPLPPVHPSTMGDADREFGVGDGEDDDSGTGTAADDVIDDVDDDAAQLIGPLDDDDDDGDAAADAVGRRKRGASRALIAASTLSVSDLLLRRYSQSYGVSPLLLGILGFAPFSMKRTAIAVFCFQIAWWRGVSWNAFFALISAPPARNAFNMASFALLYGVLAK